DGSRKPRWDQRYCSRNNLPIRSRQPAAAIGLSTHERALTIAHGGRSGWGAQECREEEDAEEEVHRAEGEIGSVHAVLQDENFSMTEGIIKGRKRMGFAPIIKKAICQAKAAPTKP